MAECKPVLESAPAAAPLGAISHQNLLDALPMAVCIVDVRGQLIGHNRLAATWWPAALQVSLAGGIPFDPYARDMVAASPAETPHMRVLRSGQKVSDVPLELGLPDGGTLRLLGSCAPVNDRHGKVIATVSSFQVAAAGHHAPHGGAESSAPVRSGRDLAPVSPDEAPSSGPVPHPFDTAGAPSPQPLVSERTATAGGSRAGTATGAQGPAGVPFDTSRSFSPSPAAHSAPGMRESGARELLRALPVAACITDVEGRITFYNDATAELAGYRPALGTHWSACLRLFHPDGTPMSAEHCPLAVTLREGRALSGQEAMAERPDGTRVSFLAHPSPLFSDEGNLVGAVNMLVDVTERRKAAQALRELNETLEQRVADRTLAAETSARELRRSERNFSLLVGSVIDYAIYMLDLSGKVTNWNAGAERIKGYRANEVIGHHFSLFYSPQDRTAGTPEAALEQARLEGRFEAEGWRVRKDGTRFWAHVVIDAVYDGSELIGFAKITRDITDRKATELERIESEQRSRGVIDTALDGFVQLDAEGRVVEWNPRAETMFGWSRAEALGQPLSALVGAVGERQAPLDQLHLLGSGRNGQLQEIEVACRDGSSITVELSISALRLASGDLLNVFIRDLTEKILIDSKLRQAQKMEAVGQLTGGIAHDFNNLLQGIIGSLDLMQWRIEKQQTADLGRFVDGALGSAKRAAAMIHRLLAFSRRQPLDPRAVRANPLIESMEELLHRTMGEQIAVAFDLAPDLWGTLCDPNQLESALLNLAINARDAMPDGGRLTIASRNMAPTPDDPAGHICIEVADTGMGMPAEVVARAFDPFYTTKPTGQGTGLGLSMVYGFTHQSKGHCAIHSTPGAGTRVQIHLPRHQDASATPARHEPCRDTGAASGEVVLVVEDDPVVRSVVIELLQRLEYRTLQAAEGTTGLDILQSDARVDLVISDIGLPGLNGRQMAELGRLARPDLKVLFMTGYAEQAAGPEGFMAPGMHLIGKPFDTQTLARRIHAMVRGD